MTLTLDQWEARLRTVAVTFTRQYGVPAVTSAGRDVRIAGQTNVPWKTGRLHDSITEQQPDFTATTVTQEVTAGGIVVRGKLVDYAGYVHDGTVHMAPRPYLDTAARETIPAFKRYVAIRAVEALT